MVKDDSRTRFPNFMVEALKLSQSILAKLMEAIVMEAVFIVVLLVTLTVVVPMELDVPPARLGMFFTTL
jgi:hypothetical protein